MLRRRRYKAVVSRDSRDCGATALATVFLQYGYHVSREKLKLLVPTDMHGTSLAALRDAATTLGLEAAAGMAKRDLLPTFPVPFIAHVQTSAGGHFVTVHEVGDEWVRVADPLLGLRILATTMFHDSWTGAVLLLKPTKLLRLESVEPPHLAAELWHLLATRPRLAMLTVASLALSSATALAVSWIIGWYFNALLGVHPTQLSFILVALGVTLFGRILASAAYSYAVSLYGSQIESALGVTYLNHLLTQPLSFFDARPSGDLIARLYEIARVRSAFLNTLMALFIDSLVLIVLAAWLIHLSLVSCVALLIFVVAVARCVRYAAKHTISLYRSLQKDAGKLHDRLIELLGSMRSIRSLVAEGAASQMLSESFTDYLRSRHSSDVTLARVQLPLQLLTGIASLGTLAIGTYQIGHHNMSPGTLITIYALSAIVFSSIERASSSLAVLEEATISAESIFETLALPPEVSLKCKVSPTSCPLVLAASEVSFNYSMSPDVLRHCTLNVSPGEFLCLLGGSGSGKSTLAAVLAGLLRPTSGTVSVKHIQGVDLDGPTVREHVLLVFQDPGLIAGTVRDNLTLGLEGITDEQLTRATTMAEAHDFIVGLRNSYDSEIGSRGNLLSTGQRQRLALARAFLRRPSILLLDEATSGLDPMTEDRILLNLRESRRSLTTLLITHRATTALRADRCVVLEEGCILEDGTPQKLLGSTSRLSEMLLSMGVVLPSDYLLRAMR